MNKVWLNNYPSSVPHEISVDDGLTLREYILASCDRHSDRIAYTHLGMTLSFAQLKQHIDTVSSYLQHEAGLNKGDRIAIMLPNCVQYPVAMFAALNIGAVIVNVNPLYTAKELRQVLQDSGAKTLVCMDLFADVVAEAIADIEVKVIVSQLGDLMSPFKRTLMQCVLKYVKRRVPNITFQYEKFTQALRYQSQAVKPVVLTASDLAFLQYTGGTTGEPKGVMLSHGNMLANIAQIKAWFTGFLNEGREVNVLALPLYHIFSLTVNCFMFLGIGGDNIVITNPKDLGALINEISKYPVTFFVGVNTLFNKLLQHEAIHKLSLKHLRVSVAGGMSVQESVALAWEKLTAVPLLEGYGLTEASPVVAVNSLEQMGFNGAIGMPLSSTEIKFVDDAGDEVKQGETGELCVRGPQVMQGYWQKEGETQKILSPEGWLKTGDVGYMSDGGMIFLKERKKDIIIVSGFNVYPNEVESVLMKHPAVAEAAVVGVADEETGERIKAFVVPLSKVEEQALFDWCHESLTNYKIPKEIEFRHDLPKTTVGKILRRELKEGSLT